MKTYKLSGYGMKRIEDLLKAIDSGEFKVELIYWDGKPSLFEVKICNTIICIWDLNPGELVKNLRNKINLAKECEIQKEEICYFANNENFENSIALRAVDVMAVD